MSDIAIEATALDMVKQKFLESGFSVETRRNLFVLHHEDGTTISFTVDGPMGAYLVIDATVTLTATLSIND